MGALTERSSRALIVRDFQISQNWKMIVKDEEV